MDVDGLRELLEQQHGVVSRRQVLELGGDDACVDRMLRRNQWARVHPGVYVNHTGPLGWVARAWSAVLVNWPAVLYGASAVDLAGEPIHVAVEHARTPVRRDGIQVHRLVGLGDRVLWNTSPPRVRLEESVLAMCAAASSPVAAYAIAADACGRRRTTPERLLAVLRDGRRLRHGTWLREALEDLAAGAGSVLEHAYLTRVERAHGLPVAARQVRERTRDGVVYRDAVYEPWGVVVELDGRLGHEAWRARAADLDRDLLAATRGLVTVRIGWRQVEDRPCDTARRIGDLLRSRGWAGRPGACMSCFAGAVSA